MTLPKPVSDHCPFVLNCVCENWVLSPFCFELSWLEVNSFQDMVISWWSDFHSSMWRGSALASKLKVLKEKLRTWAKVHWDLSLVEENLLAQELDQKGVV